MLRSELKDFTVYLKEQSVITGIQSNQEYNLRWIFLNQNYAKCIAKRIDINYPRLLLKPYVNLSVDDEHVPVLELVDFALLDPAADDIMSSWGRISSRAEGYAVYSSLDDEYEVWLRRSPL